jgi:hypothetical protein
MIDYYRIIEIDSDEPEIHNDWTDISSKSLAEKQSIKDALKTKMKASKSKYQIVHATHGPTGIGNGPCTVEDI